jgi:hypothetical protein
MGPLRGRERAKNQAGQKSGRAKIRPGKNQAGQKSGRAKIRPGKNQAGPGAQGPGPAFLV